MHKIIFLLSLCTSIWASQNTTILEIKNEYNLIKKSMPYFTKDSQNIMNLSTEGGLATAFHDSLDKIRLIKLELFGETGKIITEYYYKKDSLIFAFFTQYYYNAPINIDAQKAKEIGGEAFDQKKTKIEEKRYYFSKYKLILLLGPDKKAISKNTKQYYDSEIELTKESKEMFNKFKR